MRSWKTLLPVLALAVPVVTPAAQDSEALSVEKRSDLRGRDRLLRRLQPIRVRVNWSDMTPQDIARTLTSHAGGKIPFLWVRRGAEADAFPPVTLELKSVSLPNLLGLLRDNHGLAAVYSKGAVLLMPKEQVKPFTYLQVYDLRGATRPIRNFPGPKLGLGNGENVLFPEEEEESTNTLCGFTADALEDALRQHVTPDAWGADQVTLTNANGMFLIRHTPEGHAEVQKLLVTLGVVPPPLRIVRRR